MPKGLSFQKYIKNKDGDKVEMHTTSVNIEQRHLDFLKECGLNLSEITRDACEILIEQKGWIPKSKKSDDSDGDLL